MPPETSDDPRAIGTKDRVRLHRLTYVAEDGEVIVGRPDTGSYGVFPAAGADVLRRLESGDSLEIAAQAWRDATGEKLDIDDFLGTLSDLDFIVEHGDSPAGLRRVRWQRLGQTLFSTYAMALYLVVVLAAVVAMVLDPHLRPSYTHLFFTAHVSVIAIVMAFGQFPLLLLHEAYHALAARRLGLPSTLGIGRRYYYLVAETRMDSLYSVPRRQRYLPLLSGALVDAVGAAVFTLVAALADHLGAPRWLSELCLAFAFTGLLRILWECLFYLETDFYFVINTAARCDDLHGAARHRLRGGVARLLRRTGTDGADDYSDRDRAAARWYSPLMIIGYGVSTATLVLVGLPTAWRFWTTVVHRLDGSQPRTVSGVLDALVMAALTLTELVLLGYVVVRDLRRRRTDRSASTDPTTTLA